MKYIKNIFLVALFNYIIFGAVVLAMVKPKVETIPIPNTSPTPVTVGVTLIPSSVAVKPTIDNRCIISIDGSRYNVTDFRNLHSGGDVFQCGTDMSTIFHDRHSNRFLKQMQQYLI